MNIYAMNGALYHGEMKTFLPDVSALPASFFPAEKFASRCPTPSLPSVEPARPPTSILLPSYERKKSQSVKLLRVGLLDSGPKKAVRFADDFGLALNQIKVIATDELPDVPNAAFEHLQLTAQSTLATFAPPERTKVINYMEPLFENPIHASDFHERLSRQRIVLEQASECLQYSHARTLRHHRVSDAIDNRIYGTIKLLSCTLHKRVKVRLTTDNWLSFRDHHATYVQNSYDGTYDRFSFTVEVDRLRIHTGNTIEFCICYDSFGGPENWDNNNLQNYRFVCQSRTIPDFSI